ncbi:MAG: hypothetical protein JWP47_961, partial [Polaromonas sp.]|nr:hypothetical protein [Polaromonas sp.]
VYWAGGCFCINNAMKKASSVIQPGCKLRHKPANTHFLELPVLALCGFPVSIYYNKVKLPLRSDPAFKRSWLTERRRRSSLPDQPAAENCKLFFPFALRYRKGCRKQVSKGEHQRQESRRFRCAAVLRYTEANGRIDAEGRVENRYPKANRQSTCRGTAAVAATVKATFQH